MDCPACDGLGQVARQRPNLPLGLAEQLVVLVDRLLGEELSGYRDAETEALQSGLVGYHAAGGRGKGAVRDATGHSRREHVLQRQVGLQVRARPENRFGMAPSASLD